MWRRTVIESELGWITIVNALENQFQEVVIGGPAVLTGATFGLAGAYGYRAEQYEGSFKAVAAHRTAYFWIQPRGSQSRIRMVTGPPVILLLVCGVGYGLLAGLGTGFMLGGEGPLPRPVETWIAILVGLMVWAGYVAYGFVHFDGADSSDSELLDLMLQASNGRVAPLRPRNSIVD